jgi:Tfp pilus assembly protein PilN
VQCGWVGGWVGVTVCGCVLVVCACACAVYLVVYNNTSIQVQETMFLIKHTDVYAPYINTPAHSLRQAQIDILEGERE